MSAVLRERIPGADLNELERVARIVASTLRPGDVVLLVGDLGAGKTTFTKAAAAALGVVDVVTSPTFTIAHAYETATGSPVRSLMHLDAYRLRGADDLDAVGLFDALDDGAAAIIEWGDIVAGAFDDALVIELGVVDENTRSIAMSWDVGGRWSERAFRLDGGTPC
jgi:tRNA threonylcarbamoyladenosine biosynthesis protein TsaE